MLPALVTSSRDLRSLAWCGSINRAILRLVLYVSHIRRHLLWLLLLLLLLLVLLLLSHPWVLSMHSKDPFEVELWLGVGELDRMLRNLKLWIGVTLFLLWILRLVLHLLLVLLLWLLLSLLLELLRLLLLLASWIWRVKWTIRLSRHSCRVWVVLHHLRLLLIHDCLKGCMFCLSFNGLDL